MNELSSNLCHFDIPVTCIREYNKTVKMHITHHINPDGTRTLSPLMRCHNQYKEDDTCAKCKIELYNRLKAELTHIPFDSSKTE